jgi:hypothetical protein
MKTQTVLILCLGLILVLASCGDEGAGSRGPNLPPDTEIVSGPDSGSVGSYLAELHWVGTDEDGRVTGYEFAWSTGTVSCSEFDSVLEWHYTTKTESVFAAPADSCPGQGLCQRSNTFCVRAIDNDGAVDPEPAYLSFTATTTLPRAQIIYPTEPGQTNTTQPRCVTVRWEGYDDDGEAVEYRSTFKPYDAWPGPGIPYPQWDKTHWTPWSSDTEVVLPLNEDESIYTWSFFVQSKDNAGAIETAFQLGRNHIVIEIDTRMESKPSVELCCHAGACAEKGASIACRSSENPSQMSVPVYITVGDTVAFWARPTPGPSATSVQEIAFQLNDPSQPWYWEDATDYSNRCYPPGSGIFTVSEGINTIYVWVRDDYCEYGSTNSARMEIIGN